jgi:uncharacterized protein
MVRRLLKPLKNQSFFIFGARGTGKTHYLDEEWNSPQYLRIDLLREREFLALSRRPELLRERLESKQPNCPEWVVIDEVQRIPALLNEVHSILESKEYREKVRFILTGSSARRLKREGVNLLAGRALLNSMHPLTHLEIGESFSLGKALHWGTLPKVFNASEDNERIELLEAYVGTYIKEEIRVEQTVRQLDPFLRFLEVAAQVHGEVINYSLIGRQCNVQPRTVERYYQVLEDTLIGFYIEPFHRSVRKRQIERPKFFFFDLGVSSALASLLEVPLHPGTSFFGKRFEQFIILELYRLSTYLRKRWRFFFYTTHDGAEIDLVIERPNRSLIAIEIKSSRLVDDIEVNKMKRYQADIKAEHAVILSLEEYPRKVHDIQIFPWKDGVQWLLSL